MKSATAQLEPLLLSARDLATLLGVDRSTVWAWDASGKLGPLPVRIGTKCTRWRHKDIKEWITADCPGRGKWLRQQE